MAKSRKKKLKARREASMAMDGIEEASPSKGILSTSQSDGMDTSEIVVTDFLPASKNPSLNAGRKIAKKATKRKAVRLRKEKALVKAVSMIDKQERRLTKQELRKYGKQTLKKMD